MVERKFRSRTWTSQAISLFRSKSSYPIREYKAKQTKIMSKNMVEKAETMQKKKKKNSGIKGKKNLSLCERQEYPVASFMNNSFRAFSTFSSA